MLSCILLTCPPLHSPEHMTNTTPPSTLASEHRLPSARWPICKQPWPARRTHDQPDFAVRLLSCFASHLAPIDTMSMTHCTFLIACSSNQHDDGEHRTVGGMCQQMMVEVQCNN